MNLRAVGDKIVVVRDEPETKTPGGIVLPDGAQKKMRRGKVLSVGPGKVLNDGTRGDMMEVREGAQVVFDHYAANDWDHEGKMYLFLRIDNILAVEEP